MPRNSGGCWCVGAYHGPRRLTGRYRAFFWEWRLIWRIGDKVSGGKGWNGGRQRQGGGLDVIGDISRVQNVTMCGMWRWPVGGEHYASGVGEARIWGHIHNRRHHGARGSGGPLMHGVVAWNGGRRCAVSVAGAAASYFED